MKRYNFLGCPDADCFCYSSVDEDANGDYVSFSDLSVFQTWLEQQVASQKQEVAEAETRRESARLAYKANVIAFGLDTDPSAYDTACNEFKEQCNRLRTLEEVMLKFKEIDL